MAQLLRDVIDAGTPPSMARLPMTPEEVAASYGDTPDEPRPGGAASQGPDGSGTGTGTSI